MTPMELKVFNQDGNEVGELTLDSLLWDSRVNMGILSQALAMYRASRRAGNASTKTRSDVSGGGKKPWKQKHTGRARAGSTRSPLWRHGGSVFGPHPRSFRYELPKQIRCKALLESLKGKLHDKELVLIDQLSAKEPKTKQFSALHKAFSIDGRSIVVLEDSVSDALVKSLRNLALLRLCRAASLNAFDILNSHKVLVTKTAFEQLERRVRGSNASSN